MPSSLPLAVTNILQEFADVFPQDVPPGLPPIRGIEHQIDLIPGASLPNRAPCRTNPEETKEIMRQVQELLDKGYIRESLSPCAVPGSCQLPITSTKHDHLIQQLISHHVLTISHHNMPLQKQVRRPLLCCCKFYVAATGLATTVLTYASKPQR